MSDLIVIQEEYVQNSSKSAGVPFVHYFWKSQPRRMSENSNEPKQNLCPQ